MARDVDQPRYLALFKQNVLILAAPNQVASGTTAPVSENYILRVSTKDAARFAFAVDNATLWFALRPQTKAKSAGSESITLANFLGDH